MTIETLTKYRTTDGKEFGSGEFKQAERHQLNLDLAGDLDGFFKAHGMGAMKSSEYRRVILLYEAWKNSGMALPLDVDDPEEEAAE